MIHSWLNPRIRRIDHKLYLDFQLGRESEPLTRVLFEGSLCFMYSKWLLWCLEKHLCKVTSRGLPGLHWLFWSKNQMITSFWSLTCAFQCACHEWVGENFIDVFVSFYSSSFCIINCRKWYFKCTHWHGEQRDISMYSPGKSAITLQSPLCELDIHNCVWLKPGPHVLLNSIFM